MRDWNSHGEVGHAAGEVDIWVDVLLVFHDLLDGFAEFEEFDELFSACFGGFATEVVEDWSAVVAVLVDAVTESHEFAFFFECFVHPVGDFFGVVFWSDVVADVGEHVHGGFVCSAVEFAFECCDCAGGCSVHVGEGSGDDAGGEGGGVVVVLGVEDEGDIHDLLGFW